ncbi:MAG: protein-L-isoaspartate O-methyltransferase family protein, partial [Caldimonas sp.]
ANGQVMLEPKVEARLLQELAVQRHERVLEIGAGSGHMAALLAHRARHVTTVEIDPELARLASENLKRAWVLNARVVEADASKGLLVDGPFDVIVLSGSVAEVPRGLLAQLKPGGRLTAIVGQLPIMQALLVSRGNDAGHATVELFDTVAPRLVGFPEPSRFEF